MWANTSSKTTYRDNELNSKIYNHGDNVSCTNQFRITNTFLSTTLYACYYPTVFNQYLPTHRISMNYSRTPCTKYIVHSRTNGLELKVVFVYHRVKTLTPQCRDMYPLVGIREKRAPKFQRNLLRIGAGEWALAHLPP